MGILQVSTDKDRLDIGLIHRFLREEAYWSRGIPREVVLVPLAGARIVPGLRGEAGGPLDGERAT